jgi:hypothetical protein
LINGHVFARRETLHLAELRDILLQRLDVPLANRQVHEGILPGELLGSVRLGRGVDAIEVAGQIQEAVFAAHFVELDVVLPLGQGGHLFAFHAKVPFALICEMRYRMLRVRLQDQQGELLADVTVDDRGAVSIELSDGNIYLPVNGNLQGLPLDRPLQLVVSREPD